MAELKKFLKKVSRAIELSYPYRRDQSGRLENKAALLTEFGRFAEAETLFDQAMKDREKAGTPAGARHIEHWISRADLMLATGRAKEYLRHLSTMRQHDIRRSATINAKFQWTIARAELAAGQTESAEQHANEALQHIQTNPQREYRRDFEADLEGLLGKIMLARGRPVEAEAHLIRAAKIWRELLDPAQGIKRADAEIVHGQVALVLGKRDEAKAHLRYATAILGTHQQLGTQYLGPLRNLQAAIQGR
jgi:tetratricopeptide (TPR) repeat protein